MKLGKRNSTAREVGERVRQRIEQMTPEELVAFMTYRTPGVEETDMTGMFRDHAETKPADPPESAAAPENF